jgi:CBS domain-containing protein
LAAHRFHDTIGGEIIIVVTATTLLVELLGPPFVKLAVKRAGEIGLGVTEDDLIRSYTVADVMDPNPPVVRPTDRIQTVLNVISSDDAYLYYPVIDPQGEFQGVISLEDVKPILRDQSAVSEILVAYDLMTHCDEVVTRETPLQRALNQMREARLSFLPVVEEDGVKELAGFLDRQAIERFLSTELLRRRQVAGG